MAEAERRARSRRPPAASPRAVFEPATARPAASAGSHGDEQRRADRPAACRRPDAARARRYQPNGSCAERARAPRRRRRRRCGPPRGAAPRAASEAPTTATKSSATPRASVRGSTSGAGRDRQPGGERPEGQRAHPGHPVDRPEGDDGGAPEHERRERPERPHGSGRGPRRSRCTAIAASAQQPEHHAERAAEGAGDLDARLGRRVVPDLAELGERQQQHGAGAAPAGAAPAARLIAGPAQASQSSAGERGLAGDEARDRAREPAGGGAGGEQRGRDGGAGEIDRGAQRLPAARRSARRPADTAARRTGTRAPSAGGDAGGARRSRARGAAAAAAPRAAISATGRAGRPAPCAPRPAASSAAERGRAGRGGAEEPRIEDAGRRLVEDRRRASCSRLPAA